MLFSVRMGRNLKKICGLGGMYGKISHSLSIINSSTSTSELQNAIDTLNYNFFLVQIRVPL